MNSRPYYKTYLNEIESNLSKKESNIDKFYYCIEQFNKYSLIFINSRHSKIYVEIYVEKIKYYYNIITNEEKINNNIIKLQYDICIFIYSLFNVLNVSKKTDYFESMGKENILYRKKKILNNTSIRMSKNQNKILIEMLKKLKYNIYKNISDNRLKYRLINIYDNFNSIYKQLKIKTKDYKNKLSIKNNTENNNTEKNNTENIKKIDDFYNSINKINELLETIDNINNIYNNKNINLVDNLEKIEDIRDNFKEKNKNKNDIINNLNNLVIMNLDLFFYFIDFVGLNNTSENINEKKTFLNNYINEYSSNIDSVNNFLKELNEDSELYNSIDDTLNILKDNYNLIITFIKININKIKNNEYKKYFELILTNNNIQKKYNENIYNNNNNNNNNTNIKKIEEEENKLLNIFGIIESSIKNSSNIKLINNLTNFLDNKKIDINNYKTEFEKYKNIITGNKEYKKEYNFYINFCTYFITSIFIDYINLNNDIEYSNIFDYKYINDILQIIIINIFKINIDYKYGSILFIIKFFNIYNIVIDFIKKNISIPNTSILNISELNKNVFKMIEIIEKNKEYLWLIFLNNCMILVEIYFSPNDKYIRVSNDLLDVIKKIIKEQHINYKNDKFHKIIFETYIKIIEFCEYSRKLESLPVINQNVINTVLMKIESLLIQNNNSDISHYFSTIFKKNCSNNYCVYNNGENSYNLHIIIEYYLSRMLKYYNNSKDNMWESIIIKCMVSINNEINKNTFNNDLLKLYKDIIYKYIEYKNNDFYSIILNGYIDIVEFGEYVNKLDKNQNNLNIFNETFIKIDNILKTNEILNLDKYIGRLRHPNLSEWGDYEFKDNNNNIYILHRYIAENIHYIIEYYNIIKEKYKKIEKRNNNNLINNINSKLNEINLDNNDLEKFESDNSSSVNSSSVNSSSVLCDYVNKKYTEIISFSSKSRISLGSSSSRLSFNFQPQTSTHPPSLSGSRTSSSSSGSRLSFNHQHQTSTHPPSLSGSTTSSSSSGSATSSSSSGSRLSFSFNPQPQTSTHPPINEMNKIDYNKFLGYEKSQIFNTFQDKLAFKEYLKDPSKGTYTNKMNKFFKKYQEIRNLEYKALDKEGSIQNSIIKAFDDKFKNSIKFLDKIKRKNIVNKKNIDILKVDYLRLQKEILDLYETLLPNS